MITAAANRIASTKLERAHVWIIVHCSSFWICLRWKWTLVLTGYFEQGSRTNMQSDTPENWKSLTSSNTKSPLIWVTCAFSHSNGILIGFSRVKRFSHAFGNSMRILVRKWFYIVLWITLKSFFTYTIREKKTCLWRRNLFVRSSFGMKWLFSQFKIWRILISQVLKIEPNLIFTTLPLFGIWSKVKIWKWYHTAYIIWSFVKYRWIHSIWFYGNFMLSKALTKALSKPLSKYAVISL